jgi:membrane associated rhomboid family serine protease
MGSTGLVEDIKATFKHGSMLTRLIYVNLGVFVVVKIIDAFLLLFVLPAENPIVTWLSAYAGLTNLLHKPWGIITYMFLHQGFLHILFNLLWFYWFGKIFLEYFKGRQLLHVYLLGGIAGAFLYITAYNILPVFQSSLSGASALGASAAIYAIVLSVAMYVPNYTVYILFLGPVKIKYIAAFSIISDLALLGDGNAGGHISHIGGALFGMAYILNLRKGIDITRWFGIIVDAIANLFTPKPKLKVSYRRTETEYDYNNRKKTEQKVVDAILEKIAKSGYESLSKEEKDILFRQSRNN